MLHSNEEQPFFASCWDTCLPIAKSDISRSLEFNTISLPHSQEEIPSNKNKEI